MRSGIFLTLRLVVCSVCIATQGCTFNWQTEDRQRRDLGVDVLATGLENSSAYRDAIGARTYFAGLRTLRVRGYGLVVGLGKNGSVDCPKAIFSRLVQNLHKRHQFTTGVVGVDSVSPEDIIRGIDTAVVLVEGLIPPAGAPGTAFDVTVRAIPGTQTKSLRGGRLYSTELRPFKTVAPGAAITGKVLAVARGPLFLNPFGTSEAATQTDVLTAKIIGGARATTTRDVQLVLTEPSHRWAKLIQDRINSQFAIEHKVADAVAPSYLKIRVPKAYEKEVGHFLHLVRALFLSRDATFEAARARSLAQEITEPGAPHALIALCFEALGRSVVPLLDELYVHPKEYVRFHAAAAGLRLGEHVAADALATITEDPSSQYRFQAIRALGWADGMSNAAAALRRLLIDEDPRVAVAAYEALTRLGDRSILSIPIARDNFWLDIVDVDRPPIVYTKRTKTPRIALFGSALTLRAPLFYRSPDQTITLSAPLGAKQVNLIRTVPASGSVSPMVPTSMEVAKLIRLMGSEAEVRDDQVLGLGLDYAAVVRALYHLCEDGSINARFMLEQPNALELFGPAAPTTGRPESEL